MLIDESGSLRATDPYNQRVDGIRAALLGLANLAETSVDGRQPEVSVLMAGFFGLVRPDPEEGVPSGAWKSVSREKIDELLEEAGRYEELNQGRATDYATALLAARRIFAARAAEETREGGAPPCRVLIWFTDGRYALPRRIGKAGVGLPLTVPYAPGIRLDRPGAGEEAVAAGKRLMCKPNGLMDDLHTDGVIRFTVALSTQLSAADAAFLNAATTGSGGQRCGTRLSRLRGEYLTARDGDRLFFAFADLLASDPPVKVRKVCPKLVCARGVTTFTTVPGLSRFVVRASASAAARGAGPSGSLVLELRGPDGESAILRPDAPAHVELAGAALTQRWISDRALEVQGDFSPQSTSWIGDWSYAFVNRGALPGARQPDAYSAVELFADLEPAVSGSPVLLRGLPTRLTFELTQAESDRPVTTGPLVRSAHLTASIDDPVAGTSTRVPVSGPNPDGSFSAKIAVPGSSTAGFVYLGLTANLSTPSGTPIAPQYRSFDVPVRFPPGQGFPTLSPPSLDLPSLEGLGEAEGTLTVTGSSVAGGCVWIGEPKVEAPSDAGRIDTVVSPQSGSAARCLRLEKGEELRFDLRMTPSSEASGTVTASLPVNLRSDIVGDERVVSVPVSFAMAPSPNEAARALLLVALVILGALLPLLLLHVLNTIGARFPAPNRLRAIVLPVEMERGSALRPRDEEGPEPGVGRGEPLVRLGTRPVRELEIGGAKLETVASGSLRDRAFELFRGPYGVATAGGRQLVAGAAQPLRRWRGGLAHEVPLGLVGTWIFRLDALHPGEPRQGQDEPDPVGATGQAPDEPAGDVYFRPAASRPTQSPEEGDGNRAGEARLEGELILLISETPPFDQGDVLFKEAEEELRAAEWLWDVSDPEPPPAAEPVLEPEASSEETADWMPPPGQSRKGRDERSSGDYF